MGRFWAEPWRIEDGPVETAFTGGVHLFPLAEQNGYEHVQLTARGFEAKPCHLLAVCLWASY